MAHRVYQYHVASIPILSRYTQIHHDIRARRLTRDAVCSQPEFPACQLSSCAHVGRVEGRSLFHAIWYPLLYTTLINSIDVNVGFGIWDLGSAS